MLDLKERVSGSMPIGARPTARAKVPTDNNSVTLVGMRCLPPPGIALEVATFNRVIPETLPGAFQSIG